MRTLTVDLVDLYGDYGMEYPPSPCLGVERPSWNSTPSLEAFEKVFRHQVNELRHLYIVFDAMDECKDFEQVHAALQIIRKVSKTTLGKLHLLATSRYSPEIEDCFTEFGASCIHFEVEEVDTDIRHYIRTRFSEDPKLNRWPIVVHQEVETELMAQSQGM